VPDRCDRNHWSSTLSRRYSQRRTNIDEYIFRQRLVLDTDLVSLSHTQPHSDKNASCGVAGILWRGYKLWRGYNFLVQRTCSVEVCHQPCVKTCHWLHLRQNGKRIFSGVHNDSWRPPGAVAAFSRFRRRDVSDFIYLLTVAALHQGAPGQMTWLEDPCTVLAPLCLLLCFASVIVWIEDKNFTISDRWPLYLFYFDSETISAALAAFVFWVRRLKRSPIFLGIKFIRWPDLVR